MIDLRVSRAIGLSTFPAYIPVMPDTISAFEFLAKPPITDVSSICVLFGEEPLLKREALERIRAAVLPEEDAELSLTKFDGRQVELREVLDELATVSMFGGGRRMVVVEEADDFVSAHRPELEDYCDKPRKASVLVLVLDSWPATTRLYKKLAQVGLQINCNLPRARFGNEADEDAVVRWLVSRAQRQHHVGFGDGAAELLLEIVGPQLGRLDQELAKLALLAQPQALPGGGQEPQRTKDKGQGTTITRELIEQSVGGWRAKTAWAMIDLAAGGNAAAALVELDRLLLAGEEPIALLAMMGASLRRLAAATRVVEEAEAQRRRMTLSAALKEAGVKPFAVEKAERQLRQLGRERAKQLYRWLLEADLALKGGRSSGISQRLVLEEFIVRLSRQLASAAPK
jgi:DNA polymerase-3 subunit delta